MDEYGGQWAMAKYIEASETEDAKQRGELMEKILACKSVISQSLY